MGSRVPRPFVSLDFGQPDRDRPVADECPQEQWCHLQGWPSQVEHPSSVPVFPALQGHAVPSEV